MCGYCKKVVSYMKHSFWHLLCSFLSYFLNCGIYFLLVERVTYRKLKRRAVILEYLEKMKVVEGSYPIQKVRFGCNTF